jgi:hypothetical protein
MILNGEEFEKVDEHYQLWANTRKRGVERYVIRDVLICGVSMCFISLWQDVHVQHFSINKALVDCIEPTITACVGGFFAGLWEWHRSEERYLRAMTQQDSIKENKPV